VLSAIEDHAAGRFARPFLYWMIDLLKAVRVVGAGPAGLMAAEVLSSAGLQVTIVDHQAKPSRKFLLAGRGGLNLTHSEPIERLLARYGSARPMLEPAIRAFSPDDVRTWVAGLGVETFIGSSGRVFPVGMKASPLLRAWLRRLEGLGVVLKSREVWTDFDDVSTVLALGGASWPELGSDGGWVPIFEKAGVAVSPLQASNGRQRVAWRQGFADNFAGTPIKNVSVSTGGLSQRGEIMIARDGIEGGAVYAVASAGVRELVIDLKPDVSETEVAEKMAKRFRKDSRSNFLRKAFNLSPSAIGLMAEAKSDDPKHVVIPIVGAGDLRRAISTRGGVAFSEVDENFQLRKYPNTYVVGEMLDWDAPTGGYLLQACFSTARLAAMDLVKRLGATPLPPSA
jgi:uncharacterized flavoprotein (TIGR03862 family)